MAQPPIKYARSPLIEAVIEFRYQEAVPPKTLDLLQRRFRKLKWREEEISEFEFIVGQPKATQTMLGYRYTSDDGTRVIQVQRGSFSCSVLSPYPGWESFIEFLFESYDIWKKEAVRNLSRIGVRYINRLDIPSGNDNRIDLKDYLSFYLLAPPALDKPMDSYQVVINSGIISDSLNVNLSSGLAPSPLVDHIAMMLDIDLFREAPLDVPQKDSDIKAILELIRQRRTEIFEQCLTQASRALIS